MSAASRFGRLRRPAGNVLGLAGAGAAAATGVVYWQQHNRQLQLDAAYKNDPVLKTPKLSWVPPTREEMLGALRKSAMLPKKFEPTDDLAQARNVKVPQIGDADEGYDLLIIGGGATGAGTAVDAASRGMKVAMVERDDWSSGTSSKSTKLIHGGVRYLQKAIFELDYEQWKLVKEALHERKTFLEIAPYLSHPLPIMLPIYTYWQIPYFWSGCKLYDVLAGSQNMEGSYFMSRGKTLAQFPLLKDENLRGSLVYYDGQHNDSRMNIALVMTAVHQGAVAANHTEVVALHKNKQGRCSGARLRDNITGEEWDVKAKGIINATGPFSDGVRKLDDPSTQTIVAPSSGVHVTLPNYYSPQTMGMLDPATSDGRVIFFLPWQGNAIAGTTDSASPVTANPIPKEEEIQWILGEVRNYLSKDIEVRREDVLSAWSGIRPLVRDPDAKNTESLVRNHMINISPSGLLTIAGGKWTTYRAMAAETVDAAIKEYKLEVAAVYPCKTELLKLLGSHGWRKNLYVELIQQYGIETEVAKHLTDTYGDRAWNVCDMADKTGLRWPVHGTRIDPVYPYIDAEVKYACRREYAQTAVDVIARRTRLSFLNSQAALEALPKVIGIMTDELKWDKKRAMKEFEDAKEFLLSMGLHPELRQASFEDVKSGNIANRRSLGDDNRTAIKHDPSAGKKEERRTIPVERSGGGT